MAFLTILSQHQFDQLEQDQLKFLEQELALLLEYQISVLFKVIQCLDNLEKEFYKIHNFYSNLWELLLKVNLSFISKFSKILKHFFKCF